MKSAGYAVYIRNDQAGHKFHYTNEKGQNVTVGVEAHRACFADTIEKAQEVADRWQSKSEEDIEVTITEYFVEED